MPSFGIPELNLSAYDFGNMLFDVENDPLQQHPIQDPAIENRMIRLLIAEMQANECPPEQFERLGLMPENANPSGTLNQGEVTK